MKKKISLVVVLLMTILLLLPLSIYAKGSLNRKSTTLKVGQSFKLKLTGVKGKVKWSSSKKRIATVSKKGLVKAKKPGSTVITAKVKGKKYKCKIKVVKKNVKLPFYASETNITVGIKKKRIDITFVGEGELYFDREVPFIAQCEWGVPNNNTYPLYISGTNYGNGNTKIRISNSVDKRVITLNIKVDVDPKLKFENIKDVYYVGETEQIDVSYDETVSPILMFSSSNPDVAFVTRDGKINPLSEGTATITVTAKYQEKSISKSIRVIERE